MHIRTKMQRRLSIIAGAIVFAFGVLCLNYTKMGSAENHAQFAQARGWPPPSPGIVHLGMLLAPFGAGVIGFALGKKSITES